MIVGARFIAHCLLRKVDYVLTQDKSAISIELFYMLTLFSSYRNSVDSFYVNAFIEGIRGKEISASPDEANLRHCAHFR